MAKESDAEWQRKKEAYLKALVDKELAAQRARREREARQAAEAKRKAEEAAREAERQRRKTQEEQRKRNEK